MIPACDAVAKPSLQYHGGFSLPRSFYPPLVEPGVLFRLKAAKEKEPPALSGGSFSLGGLYYQVQQKGKGLTGEHKSGKMEKTHTNQITKEAVL